MQTVVCKDEEAIMAQTQRVLLEFPADEAGLVKTLANKLGWKVIAENERGSEQDTSMKNSYGEIYKTEQIDWSKYSPEIQHLRSLLNRGRGITAEDVASDPRLAYILSK